MLPIANGHKKSCVFARFGLKPAHQDNPFASNAMHAWSKCFEGRFKPDWKFISNDATEEKVYG